MRFAKFHHVVYIVARIKQQPADGRIRHLIVRQGDRAHMQSNHHLDILPLLAHPQFHLEEIAGNHLFADEFMIVERPSHTRIET